eukprot:PLAT11012.2.p1 GENE.PLAT11012.2~~PLAT11012.2.p1  ORF type:complete len:376 (+),score=126.45 PLAT11012.2:279-1406(+)
MWRPASWLCCSLCTKQAVGAGLAAFCCLPATAQPLPPPVAACTSIVVEQKDSGKPLHVRTMDWLMPFDLRPLTLQLEFTQGGRLLYTATTWLGFVGIYSASRPGAFSISINYRQTGGNVLHNLAAALTGGAALGSCIRSVCTREDSFEQAVMHCSRAPLAAPCYIIIAGCQAGQGVVLTRERRRSVRPRLLSEGPLVQVNSDSWDVDPLDDVLESKARRRTAQRLLSKLAKQPSCAWDVAARDPIYNWITVYAFVACAADGLYESKVRCGPSAGDILRQQEEWEEEQGIAAEEEEEEDASAASGIASFFSGLLNFGPESSWGDDMAAVAAAVRERELAEEAYDEAADSDFVPDDEDDMEEDEWADYADEPLDAMD